MACCPCQCVIHCLLSRRGADWQGLHLALQAPGDCHIGAAPTPQERATSSSACLLLDAATSLLLAAAICLQRGRSWRLMQLMRGALSRQLPGVIVLHSAWALQLSCLPRMLPSAVMIPAAPGLWICTGLDLAARQWMLS